MTRRELLAAEVIDDAEELLSDYFDLIIALTEMEEIPLNQWPTRVATLLGEEAPV